MLYFGPDADQRWEWITPGSLFGTLILLCVSLLFRVYVQNWANYRNLRLTRRRRDPDELALDLLHRAPGRC